MTIAPEVRAGEEGLVDAHAASRLGVYLRLLWQRRGYTLYVARAELRQRQITTVFGSFWHLLNPALSIGVYFLIFGLVLETDRGVGGTSEFLLFLTIGLFAFQFTQRSVTLGSTSVVLNRGLIQAIRFPRALLPGSTTLMESLAAIPTYVIIFVMAVAVGEPPSWRWLMLPVLFIWQGVFNLGAALVAARLTTHFRDAQQLLPFFFRLLIYGSGVLFSVDAYVTAGPQRALFVLNPMYGFIEISRWSVMGFPVDLDVVIASAVWTIVMLVGGFLWFRAAEHTYDRV